MIQEHIVAGRVYEIAYECRDLGYGVEEGFVTGYFTGERDAWGKHTIVPVDGSAPLFLFADEVSYVDETDLLTPSVKAQLAAL